MSNDLIESYLFIGGIVDGQWFNVPKTSRVWAVPVITEVLKPSWITNPETIPNEVPYYDTKYYRFKIAFENRPKPSYLFVFVHESIYNPNAAIYADEHHYKASWNIMCKLVNNYKVVK